jgi:hypothetical protein
MTRNSGNGADAGWALTDVSQHVPVLDHDWNKVLCDTDEQGRPSNERPQHLPKNWEQNYQAAMYRGRIISLERNNRNLTSQLEKLNRRLEQLCDRVTNLTSCVNDYRSRPTILPISTFAPEPYEMLGAINIILRQEDDGFIASFAEANINASGGTQAEAIEMVKDVILGTFDRLTGKDDDELGPGPLRQKQVLSALIRQTN